MAEDDEPVGPMTDYDPREAVAAAILRVAQERFQKNAPNARPNFEDDLQGVLDQYPDTAAGEQAKRLLAELRGLDV